MPLPGHGQRGATLREREHPMPRGGARTRSGPAPDPKSGRSDRRGLYLGLTELPAGGYTGDAPAWPLPGELAREAEMWATAWTYPQAAAWSCEPWRHATIAMWVRWFVRAEDPEASAATLAQVHRLADQIGLTPAGLLENGWTITKDELAGARDRKAADAPAATPPVRRMRAVPGGGA